MIPGAALRRSPRRPGVSIQTRVRTGLEPGGGAGRNGFSKTRASARNRRSPRILDAIEKPLPHQATTPSRHRKLMVNLVPPWAADLPIWELRVGTHRVFYDVAPEEGIVYVRAIRLKRAGKRTEEIL